MPSPQVDYGRREDAANDAAVGATRGIEQDYQQDLSADFSVRRAVEGTLLSAVEQKQNEAEQNHALDQEDTATRNAEKLRELTDQFGGQQAGRSEASIDLQSARVAEERSRSELKGELAESLVALQDQQRQQFEALRQREVAELQSQADRARSMDTEHQQQRQELASAIERDNTPAQEANRQRERLSAEQAAERIRLERQFGEADRALAMSRDRLIEQIRAEDRTFQTTIAAALDGSTAWIQRSAARRDELSDPVRSLHHQADAELRFTHEGDEHRISFSVDENLATINRNIAQGNQGERLAAYALRQDGHEILDYKPDVQGTSTPGFDLVTLRKDEAGRYELWLVDNKALTRSGVSSVTALTSSFDQNKEALRDRLEERANSPTVGADEREKCRAALDALEGGNFRKVVTNANVSLDDALLRNIPRELAKQGVDFPAVGADEREKFRAALDALKEDDYRQVVASADTALDKVVPSHISRELAEQGVEFYDVMRRLDASRTELQQQVREQDAITSSRHADDCVELGRYHAAKQRELDQETALVARRASTERDVRDPAVASDQQRRAALQELEARQQQQLADLRQAELQTYATQRWGAARLAADEQCGEPASRDRANDASLARDEYRRSDEVLANARETLRDQQARDAARLQEAVFIQRTNEAIKQALDSQRLAQERLERELSEKLAQERDGRYADER